MTDMFTATELAYKNGQVAAEKTLSQLRRENIQLRAENEKLEMVMNNYRISSEAFAEENYAISAELKMLRAERDAAVADLAVEKDCRFCKFHDESIRVGMYCGREDCDYGESDKWEWRGANV